LATIQTIETKHFNGKTPAGHAVMDEGREYRILILGSRIYPSRRAASQWQQAHESPTGIRRRGGRARARNLRLRLARKLETPPLAPPEHTPETAREASALLDERFPWLRGAELRTARRRAA